jgi:hypothetical protein
MHQENIRFSARTAGGIVQVTKAEESLALWSVRASLPSAREDSRAATQKGRARTQNKVLVIMDYGIFRKQVYRRTGGQRDSILKVTDSIQRGIELRVVSINIAQFNMLLTAARHTPLEPVAMIGGVGPGRTESFCRLGDLDVMVPQQIACRVVQLSHGNLKIYLRLNEI